MGETSLHNGALAGVHQAKWKGFGKDSGPTGSVSLQFIWQQCGKQTGVRQEQFWRTRTVATAGPQARQNGSLAESGGKGIDDVATEVIHAHLQEADNPGDPNSNRECARFLEYLNGCPDPLLS